MAGAGVTCRWRWPGVGRNWPNEFCVDQVSGLVSGTRHLTPDTRHLSSLPFSAFRAKLPLAITSEHATSAIHILIDLEAGLASRTISHQEP